nr:zinc knuckle CX2CX4HX4C [Tanacetum cinerariifolium]
MNDWEGYVCIILGTGNVVESTRATNNVMFGTEKAAMDATEMVWKKLLADVTGNMVKSKPDSYMGAVGASASKPCKAKANFRSLYSDNLCNGVDFTIPSKVVETVSTRSENTVYSYFIGKRVAFPVVEYYVSNNWGKYGLTRIVMNSKGFFFFIFNTSKGLEDVLENGSWKIRNIPVILKKWNMNSSLLIEELTHILVWVKIHDVPLKSNDGFQTVVNKKNDKAGSNIGVKFSGQSVKSNVKYMPKASNGISKTATSKKNRPSKASELPSSSSGS